MIGEVVQDVLRSPGAAIYALALWVWAAALLLEAGWSALRGRRLYDWRDTAANLTLYAGYALLAAGWAWVVLRLYVWLHARAPLQLVSGAFHLGQDGLLWEWGLLFLLEDLCFYAFHRASHRWRFFWAAHAPHHSSARFNLSVAFRQGWTPFFAVLFWCPLPLLGFDPLMILTLQSTSLLYQVWLHTELVPSLGPLEWVLNTPRHHRLHHAVNAPYRDRNLGGVLIVWDRLFGTFARASEPPRWGVEPALESRNPLVIAFHEWAELGRALLRR